VLVDRAVHLLELERAARAARPGTAVAQELARQVEVARQGGRAAERALQAVLIQPCATPERVEVVLAQVVRVYLNDVTDAHRAVLECALWALWRNRRCPWQDVREPRAACEADSQNVATLAAMLRERALDACDLWLARAADRGVAQ
jgi:hypothetical protein